MKTIDTEKTYAWPYGRFEIEMPGEAADDMSGPGPADSAVSYWQYRIARPEECTPERLAEELRDYGAWDAEELADDSANWGRILWITAGNIYDEDDRAEFIVE